MTEPDVMTWEANKKPFKPGETGGASVRVNKAAAPKKETVRKITEAEAAGWWHTAFEVIGDAVSEPVIWALDDKEAKKLGKPSAVMYNDMPAKLRQLLGMENLKQGAFFFACIQLAFHLRKAALTRFVETQMSKASEQAANEPEMTVEQFQQGLASMMANGRNG
jgi:hypothetical protein